MSQPCLITIWRRRQDDAPSSRNVRPSTHSRRGRRGPGQFPCSASPDATRRFPAGEESDDVESPEGKASGAGTLDGSYHRSPGRRTGLSTAPRDTALPGRNRSVRQSRRGSNLSRTPTAVAVLERARRDHRFARETRSGGDNALFSISAAWGRGGADGTGGGCGDDQR